jgi:hypothetical protein
MTLTTQSKIHVFQAQFHNNISLNISFLITCVKYIFKLLGLHSCIYVLICTCVNLQLFMWNTTRPVLSCKFRDAVLAPSVHVLRFALGICNFMLASLVPIPIPECIQCSVLHFLLPRFRISSSSTSCDTHTLEKRKGKLSLSWKLMYLFRITNVLANQ